MDNNNIDLNKVNDVLHPQLHVLLSASLLKCSIASFNGTDCGVTVTPRKGSANLDISRPEIVPSRDPLGPSVNEILRRNNTKGILFPFTLPSLIMRDVEIMFNISFCAVPDFILVLPVMNSGPTSGVIG